MTQFRFNNDINNRRHTDDTKRIICKQIEMIRGCEKLKLNELSKENSFMFDISAISSCSKNIDR